jgi:hypothetical protein
MIPCPITPRLERLAFGSRPSGTGLWSVLKRGKRYQRLIWEPRVEVRLEKY